MDYSYVRGFNYQPSYASTTLEAWQYFDADIIKKELENGKKYFPKFNTVRLWLSWDSYFRKPDIFKKNFETLLEICGGLGLKSIPILFNRWHDANGYDVGGVYLDNLIPGHWTYYRDKYLKYAADIISSHKNDDRILIWDLCNEPFSYDEIPDDEMFKYFEKVEMDWLTDLYKIAKEEDPDTPASVSTHALFDRYGLEKINPVSDVLLIHPYFEYTDAEGIADKENRCAFEERIKLNADYAKEVNKPMLVTETCWGAYEALPRANNTRFTLQTISKYGLGFIAHALYYSLIADLHDKEDGFIGRPGNLCFINKDGSLRKGHEVFNEF